MPAMLARLLLFLCFASCTAGNSKGSAYDLLAGIENKTAVFAGGCFWCVEEAFERYVPGVMEAVSGFSGGEMINPTYKNHNGHFEVVKVIYNPALTSYQVLVDYYWRNIDPFDDQGQFCDKGGAYKPAIFYSDDAERLIAEQSKAAIQEKLGTVKVVVPILPTKPFWTGRGCTCPAS
jgi:peptide-methionine (S)-S-oxide reductase